MIPTNLPMMMGQEEELQEQVSLLEDEDFKNALKGTIDDLEKKDRPNRDKLLRIYKKHNSYWEGIQDVYWDERARDWRRVKDHLDEDTKSDETSSADRESTQFNIYRAHGESIIAALTAAIPGTRFFPEDADSPEDLSTAKAYSKMSKKIERDNDVGMLFVKSLFILYNQGFVAAYTYHHISEEEYGSVSIPYIEVESEVIKTALCPNCGNVLESEGEPVNCESCGETVEPVMDEFESEPMEVEKTREEPRGKECLEIYGPLNVKVPDWVTKVDDAPYLILELDQHYALMQDLYPDFKDEIKPANTDTNERWARQSSELGNTSNDSDLVSHKRVWLRPFAYNLIRNDKSGYAERLREEFPDGLLVTLVGTTIVEMVEDNLDKRWTISASPLSTHIHSSPIGKSIIPVQEMKNDMVNLTYETIRHGIPENYADPNYFNFDAYRKVKNTPGLTFPLQIPPGKSLDAVFAQRTPATLSKEVEPFHARLDQEGQFLSGDLPSVHGGQIQGGSGTFSEYQLSGNRALQRLGLTWKIINAWWPLVMGKACRSYHDNLRYDDKFVQQSGSSFLNVWIRQSEASGKVGHIEAESSDTFPMTNAQKAQKLMEFINMKDEMIMGALFHPENSHLIASLLGFGDIYIPGDDDRNKQLIEIAQMINGVPIPVNPELDNHQVEVEVCRAWLISEAGLEAQQMNPEGYNNVFMHYMEHKQMTMPPMPPPENGGETPPAPGSEQPKQLEDVPESGL